MFVTMTDLARAGAQSEVVAAPHRVSMLFNAVHTFYDFFMIGCASEIAQRGKHELSASIQHAFGAVLCDRRYLESARRMPEHMVGKRMRMNANEYVIASLVSNSHRNMSASMQQIAENGNAALYSVVVPADYRVAVLERIDKAKKEKGEKVKMPPMSEEDVFEIQRIQMLLFYGVEASSVASRRYEIYYTDKRLYQRFGGDQTALRVGTDIVVQNMACLIPLVHSVNRIMKQRLSAWVRVAGTTIYQIALGEDSLMCADTTRSVGAQSIGYPMSDRPMEMLMVRAALRPTRTSSSCHGTTSYAMSSGHAQLESVNMFARSRKALRQGPFLEHVLQRAVYSRQGAEQFGKLMEFFALEISYMFSYPELRQLFVVAGSVSVVPPPSPNSAEMALVTQECWLSLASFVVANMRFAPMFDIILVVYEDNGNMDCSEYRVDGYDASSRMIFNSVSHSGDGTSLEISFSLDMTTMKNCICRMPPVGSREGGLMPSDRANTRGP
jgi:hypothetical protein